MEKIKFLFGIHNHQPVGNFGHVFEQLFESCYRPYLETLAEFKRIKTAVHFSGPLLEWIKEHQPDYLRQVADLASEGRVEILSGGFYEPLLATLPESDAIGQIRMMNDFVRKEFGVQPRGLWLAERIWTPELPKVISDAGIEYTIVDDTHFYYSGLEKDQIHGYYITEKHGHPLKIFPISKDLRYAIPFKQPEETLDVLGHARETRGIRGVTYADDGEKFGGWPETYQWVYEEKWLHRFFTAIEANADWIDMVTFGEFIDGHPPTGRIYLPMASYDEMMEWSLPTPAGWKFHDLKAELESRGLEESLYKVFLRGGQWDNFLTKYEESNHLHKKMLYVSRKVNALPEELQQSSGARRELYRGQCNCAQWHGLFGGLYLNYLRHALYNHLLAAENIADEKRKESPHYFEVTDFNLDGRDEVLFSNPLMNAYVSPAYGGGMWELDYRPLCFNLGNVLRRREETYHRLMREQRNGPEGDHVSPHSIHDRVRFKEEGMEARLAYDRWERYSFLDHFLGPETTLETFRQCRFEEQGDFAGEPFDLIEPPSLSRNESEGCIKLQREGTVHLNGTPHPLTVEKEFTFSLQTAEISARYRIINRSAVPLSLWWGLEFNLTLLAGDAEDRYYFRPLHTIEDRKLNSEGVLDSVEEFGLRDDWFQFGVLLQFSSPVTLWRFPVETISQSEDGFERTYQGSCLLAHSHLELSPESAEERLVTLKVGSELGSPSTGEKK